MCIRDSGCIDRARHTAHMLAGAAHDEVVQEVVAETEDDRGGCAVARLRTPEAYAFTPIAAAAVIERVLAGDVEAGFQTPARVYGSEFVLTLPGVTREDLR